MNITFLIGNGFDLHVGLKTSYKDFYSYFLEHASKDNIIANWIGSEDYELWSDLEIGLGKHIAKLNIEDTSRFYNDRVELEDLLAEYLELEQIKFSQLMGKKGVEVTDEFKKSILRYDNGLSLADSQKVTKVKELCRNEQYIYNFVTFNYTNIMDLLIAQAVKTNPIDRHLSTGKNPITDHIGKLVHVHGETNSGMILGVNDKSQINNPEFQNDPVFTKVFVKKEMNTSIGDQKIIQASNLLQSSMIIAVYGMAFGETDTYWWEKIYQWLLENNSRLLLIYYYSPNNELRRNNPQRRILATQKAQNLFLSRIKKISQNKDINSLRDRILISFNNNLFQFNVE